MCALVSVPHHPKATWALKPLFSTCKVLSHLTGWIQNLTCAPPAALEKECSLLVLMIHKACKEINCPSPRLDLHVTWCSHKKGLTVTDILSENELKPFAITFPINSSFPTISAATQWLKFKPLQRPISPLQLLPVLLPMPLRGPEMKHTGQGGDKAVSKEVPSQPPFVSLSPHSAVSQQPKLRSAMALQELLPGGLLSWHMCTLPLLLKKKKKKKKLNIYHKSATGINRRDKASYWL